MSYDPLTDLKTAIENAAEETNEQRLNYNNQLLLRISEQLERVLLHLSKITDEMPNPGEGVK